jgi:hypothetical protein
MADRAWFYLKDGLVINATWKIQARKSDARHAKAGKV